MDQRWRPVARAKAYELVVDQIEEQILTGALVVGDRLPAERDLADRMGVSRAAVREALRMLEAQGVLRSGVGSGPDAGTVVSALPAAALARFLRMHVALANFPIDDVLEARVVLERSSVALAAARAGAVELAALQEPLVAMRQPQVDRATFNELDSAFHVAIAEAGGNRLVADITTAIRDSMRRPIMQRFELLGERWEQVRDRLRMEHEELYRAIAAGETEVAQRLVEEHIRGAHAVLGDVPPTGREPHDGTGASGA